MQWFLLGGFVYLISCRSCFGIVADLLFALFGV